MSQKNVDAELNYFLRTAQSLISSASCISWCWMNEKYKKHEKLDVLKNSENLFPLKFAELKFHLEINGKVSQFFVELLLAAFSRKSSL